jgi:E3 ubiquitin-protein ligase TRIP12
VELKAGGKDIVVMCANVEEYLQLVVDATLGSGIKAQVEAFRSGFEEVFPLRHLYCFYEDEIESMLCGSDDAWDVDLLFKVIKFDHGYSGDSAPVRHFVELLCELDRKERKAFLRFVTGSPRLPPGGLSSLQPQLTVVRKHPSGGDVPTPGTTPGTPGVRDEGTTLADGDLPSVMTCANYIKLPPYSCKEVLKERLMYAIREGQGSFDLS